MPRYEHLDTMPPPDKYSDEANFFIIHDGAAYVLVNSNGCIVNRDRSQPPSIPVSYQTANGKIYPDLYFRFLSQNHQIAFFEDSKHTPFCSYLGGDLFQICPEAHFSICVKDMVRTGHLSGFRDILKHVRPPRQNNIAVLDMSKVYVKKGSVQQLIDCTNELEKAFSDTFKKFCEDFPVNLPIFEKRKAFWESTQGRFSDPARNYSCALLAQNQAHCYRKKYKLAPLLSALVGAGLGALSAIWLDSVFLLFGITGGIGAFGGCVGLVYQKCFKDNNIVPLIEYADKLNQFVWTNLPCFSHFIENPILSMENFYGVHNEIGFAHFGARAFSPEYYRRDFHKPLREPVNLKITDNMLCGKTVIPCAQQAKFYALTK